MKIYVAHSSGYDYQNELYSPIRNSTLNTKHQITLPHENSIEQFNSKEFLKKCNLVIADVSYPSTGLGIELGWANIYNVPIVCVFKFGTKPSSSIKSISNILLEYKDPNEMIEKLNEYLNMKK